VIDRFDEEEETRFAHVTAAQLAELRSDPPTGDTTIAPPLVVDGDLVDSADVPLNDYDDRTVASVPLDPLRAPERPSGDITRTSSSDTGLTQVAPPSSDPAMTRIDAPLRLDVDPEGPTALADPRAGFGNALPRAQTLPGMVPLGSPSGSTRAPSQGVTRASSRDARASQALHALPAQPQVTPFPPSAQPSPAGPSRRPQPSQPPPIPQTPTALAPSIPNTPPPPQGQLQPTPWRAPTPAPPAQPWSGNTPPSPAWSTPSPQPPWQSGPPQAPWRGPPNQAPAPGQAPWNGPPPPGGWSEAPAPPPSPATAAPSGGAQLWMLVVGAAIVGLLAFLITRAAMTH
jgi:hypothetical protein